MLLRVAESWLLLLYFDWLMHFRGFQEIHAAVRNLKPRAVGKTARGDGELSRAVDLACVFYFKPVLCLQRSATTTVLLRRYGRNAEMVIGAQLLPFQSHAWVEIDGRVINDKPYVTEIFEVLERC
ncbi:hypothetical protein HDF16_005124 [Granulicella aggregans]|uniref:Microcin J25-processing protein McjB C-terminal domain-containing protein n=1 Tax=Granulicella aggregans TaxID=474949 RepID=A0A7W7ZIJ4_9BACT|nr:lasso peptide biosynthesis B2 protein [Granulicella aggregans]MBB5060388.1 hypothetical protein [Granulicella aggregans]